MPWVGGHAAGLGLPARIRAGGVHGDGLQGNGTMSYQLSPRCQGRPPGREGWEGFSLLLGYSEGSRERSVENHDGGAQRCEYPPGVEEESAGRGFAADSWSCQRLGTAAPCGGVVGCSHGPFRAIVSSECKHDCKYRMTTLFFVTQ